MACHIAIKICEGLHYAHNKRDHFGKRLNLVHRDISPHNILISNEGEVKIIDFGIVKAEGRTTQTIAGLVKGKFAYMSPEQIRGLPVDHRSDVFATGILLHEMLTCRPLFQARSEFETLKRARSANAAPPSTVNAEVPRALDVIVLKALARHVDDRYQSNGEFRDALWAFAQEHNTLVSTDQLGAENDSTSAEVTLVMQRADATLKVELASAVSQAPNRVPLVHPPSVFDRAHAEFETGEDLEPPEAQEEEASTLIGGSTREAKALPGDSGKSVDDQNFDEDTSVDDALSGATILGSGSEFDERTQVGGPNSIIKRPGNPVMNGSDATLSEGLASQTAEVTISVKTTQCSSCDKRNHPSNDVPNLEESTRKIEPASSAAIDKAEDALTPSPYQTPPPIQSIPDYEMTEGDIVTNRGSGAGSSQLDRSQNKLSMGDDEHQPIAASSSSEGAGHTRAGPPQASEARTAAAALTQASDSPATSVRSYVVGFALFFLLAATAAALTLHFVR